MSPSGVEALHLSIIVPVYNEHATVVLLLERLKSLSLPFAFEIVVVDDGSVDGSTELLRRFDTDDRIRVISRGENRGKGAAVRLGAEEARGEFIIIQDSDLELNPSDIGPIVMALSQHPNDAVYGSRFLRPQRNRVPVLTVIANRTLTLLTNVLFGSRLTDMETCYKAMKRTLFLSLDLRANRFDIEPEITARLMLQGCRIVEIPIFYSPRSRRSGKKIRASDAIAAAVTLVRLRLSKLTLRGHRARTSTADRSGNECP
jgi:glycosyltransferase involved in cell wall biosynthesis